MPGCALISSMIAPRGQPSPGNAASSAGKPVVQPLRVGRASLPAVHTRPGGSDVSVATEAAGSALISEIRSGLDAVAYQSDGNPFDHQRVAPGVDHDGLEVGVGRQQADDRTLA